MAIVFKTGGYDPPPPHVYVWSERGIAKVDLGRTEEDVHVVHSTGMEQWEKARIVMIVRAFWTRLVRKWEALHGSKN